MKKTLYDLTKEDWNTLFPIELVDHNPEWKNIYENEKQRILKKIEQEKILRMKQRRKRLYITVKILKSASKR